MARLSDIVNMLPYRMRGRFESLGSYVHAIIEEEQQSAEKPFRLSRDEIQQIQLVVVVSRLHDFFREGSGAARNAVGVFDSLGIPGFSVGNTRFEGRNTNVVRGDRLAQSLRKRIDIQRITGLPSRGDSFDSRSVRDLVKDLIKRVVDAKRVD